MNDSEHTSHSPAPATDSVTQLLNGEPALKQWSDKIRRRLSGLEGLEEKQIKQLAIALQVRMDRAAGKKFDGKERDVTLETHWLTGRAVPETPAQHELLLAALGIHADKDRYMNGTARFAPILMQTHEVLSFLYARIDDKDKTANPVAPAPKRPGTARNAWENSPREAREVGQYKTDGYKDHSSIPPRLKDAGVTYQQVENSRLSAMLGDGEGATQNAHEFLCAFAARYDLSDLIMSKMLASEDVSTTLFWRARNGGGLPMPSSLPFFKAVMDRYAPRYYPRFEALVVANRLAIANHLEAQARTESDGRERGRLESTVTIELEHIPAQYWRSFLIQASKRSTNLVVGDEAHKIVIENPILTKGDYLRAVRLARGKTVGEMAALAHQSNEDICNIEHFGSDTDCRERQREKLTQFYERLDAEEAAAAPAGSTRTTPLFRRSFYDGRPLNKKPLKAACADDAEHRGTLQQPKTIEQPKAEGRR